MKVTNLITEEILKDLQDINEKCRKMHLPSPPMAFISFEVQDANGKIIETYESKSNSWVRNAHNYLISTLFPAQTAIGTYGAGGLVIKNVAGTSYSSNTYPLSTEGATLAAICFEAATTGNFGIWLGSGTNAESFEDYALQTRITAGTAAGQLVHQAMAIPTPTYDIPTKTWTQVNSRVFNNNGSADVSVNEMGIIEYLAYTTSNAYFLMARDLLASTIVVPVGGQLTARYTVTYTMPA